MVTSIPQLRLAASQRTGTSPLAAGRSLLDRTVRIPIVLKPSDVRLGNSVSTLNKIAANLTKAGVNFRFVAPILVNQNDRLIDHQYFEHSGQAVEGLDKPEPAKKWYGNIFGPYMKAAPESAVKGPIIAVVIEVEASSVDQALSIFRGNPKKDYTTGIIGATNPLKQIRTNPDKAEAEREAVRYSQTTALGQRIGSLPGTEEAAEIYNCVHCPASPFEAKTQLKVMFRKSDLAGFYTEAEIDEILGSTPYPVDREALLLSGVTADRAKATAAELKQTFRGFKETSVTEIELLLRQFTALSDDFVRQEDKFHSKLGLQPEKRPLADKSVPPAHLYLVAGASGAGKSTAADILEKQGEINALVPQYAFGTAGKEETQLTPESATELLGLNFFLASQPGYEGSYYLIPGKPLAEFARVQGGRMLGFVSEDHIRAIQAWAVGHPELAVHTAHLSVPENLLLARIAADPTRQRETRIDDTLAICRGLEARSSTFEHKIDGSGTPEEVARQFLAWFTAAEAGRIAGKALPPAEIDTPRAFFTRQLIVILMNKLTFDVVQESYTDPYDLTTRATPLLQAEMDTLYYEAYRQVNGRPPETAEERAVMGKVVAHVINVMESALQAYMPFEERTAANSKLTQLCGSNTEADRMMANLDAIEKLAQSIPMEEALLLAALHDLGKMAGFVNHAPKSGSIVKDLHLPARMGAENFVPAEDLALDEVVIAHHHDIGNTFVPDCSLRQLLTLFEDRRVRDLIWDGTAVNVARAEKLLDRLLFLTLIDVAGNTNGGADGFLFNLDAEKYRESHAIALAAVRQATSYEDIMSFIARQAEEPSRNVEQMGISLAMMAGEGMDEPAEGLKYYAGLVSAATERAIAAREISAADWTMATQNVQYIRETSYYLSAHLPGMKAGSDDVPAGYSEKINVNFLKYQIARAKMASIIREQLGRDTMLYFSDPAGKMLYDEVEISTLLNRVMSSAGPGVEIEVVDNTIHLLDGNGQRLAGITGTFQGINEHTAALQIQLG